MKYNVHIFTVVRVDIPGIIADTQEEALKQADEKIDCNRLFNRELEDGTSTQWGEEHVNALIDIDGDTEFKESRWITL